MNEEFSRQLPPEDRAVTEVLQTQAQSIQVNPAFQARLEAELKQRHPANKQPDRRMHIKILPALGWALLAIAAFLVLNWAVRSLVPDRQPAVNGTPVLDVPFVESIKAGSLCSGELAVAHGFSVFLITQDKNGIVELDEGKNIGELRSFAWSPNGGQLAIVGNTRGSGNLYKTDAAGDQLQPILSNSELGYLVGVSWSHDGRQLLTWEIDNNTKLHLMNKDGTNLTEIDLPLQFFETPQFAPDDESIVFYGTNQSEIGLLRQSATGLFRMKVDGSQDTMISDLVADESSFAWSQDGSRLAYIEMDRDLGEARLVVEGDGGKDIIATLPIPKGSGSSIPNSANLSWSSDGRRLVFEFGRNASDRTVFLANTDGTGLVKLAESAHAPAISADGKCLAYISNQEIFLLDLTTISSSATGTAPILLAELPTGRGSVDFRLDKLQWSPETIPAPDIQNETDSIRTPSGTEYDWRGSKLYLNTPLPEIPVEASVYQLKSEQPATLDSVQALAEQFGMKGTVYEAPSELGSNDSSDFIVEEGNQRLRVRSNLYFSYYPDYTRWATGSAFGQVPDQATAETMIADFLHSHGYDFVYDVKFSEFYTGYYALPLTPDGLAIHHEHFKSAGFLFRFDDTGIIAVEASLVDYTPVQTFGIIPAESAFQKILDPNAVYGILEGVHSVNDYVKTWYRPRPENQTVTVWGWISSIKSVDGSSPLVTFDGYQVTGNITDLAESTPNTFVQATGQFQEMEGVKTFNIDTWQVYNGYEDGLQGNLQREGDKVTITTVDGNVLFLPDVPADLTLPLENAFVLGVTQGDVFEWKSIDTRVQGGGGGGGGGGGSGFYKPNFTGTPVPLPTPQIQQETNIGSGKYNVQEGDTLSAIAETHDTTVEELMQVNGLAEPNILIGQVLIIPGIEAQPTQSLIGQEIVGQRGTLTVTIFNQLNGGQRIEYTFQTIEEKQFLRMKLEGKDMDALQEANNRPIKVWGTIDHYQKEHGMDTPILFVERFEILYPEQQFQILKGTQSIIDVQGKSITLFTTNDGQTYAQPDTFAGLIGNEGDQVLVETLILPDETIAGYPVLQIASASMAINPKSGEPVDMEVTADQPYVIEESQNPEPPEELTATIESVELVYFTPDKRYAVPDPSAGLAYIQPAWRFRGHYWDGSEFEILIQALKEEFLLPEVDSVEPPG